jgi:hypothetical protein
MSSAWLPQWHYRWVGPGGVQHCRLLLAIRQRPHANGQCGAAVSQELIATTRTQAEALKARLAWRMPAAL